MPSGALHWTFTIYDLGFNTTPWQSHVEFMVYQQEKCPTTQREHLQGYLKLKTRHVLSWMKKKMHPEAHWEIKHHSVADNVEYCTRLSKRIPGTQPVMFGEVPKEAGHRSDLEAVVQMVQEQKTIEEIATTHPTTFIRNYRGIYEYRNVTIPVPNEKPIVYVLFGDSNTGKSHFGHTLGTYFPVPIDANKAWFNGYDGEDVLQIEEYKGQWDINFLKAFLDDRKCQLPVKGGYTRNRSKYIVITSNYDVCDWYPNLTNVDRIALLRRIDFYYKLTGTSYIDAVVVNMRAPLIF